MVGVELFCAIAGEAESAFLVTIDDTKSVYRLKEVIKNVNSDDPTLKNVPVKNLQLFLAKKKKGAGAWLTEKDVQKGVSDTSDLKPLIVMREPLAVAGLSKDEVAFTTPENTLGAEKSPVNVLVVVEPAQTRVWLVTGSVENALNTKGVRFRLYRLVASYLGYFDPARSTGDVLWYEGNTLNFHALFKTEENALLFDNVVHDERITQLSPLYDHAVSTNVAPVSRELTVLRRIYSQHYVPQDTESAQETLLSHSTEISIVDMVTDEFKYQRIESEKWFGTMGKAESCHLMSREHCRSDASYLKYDNDPNNRLALSPAMHAWYDGRSCVVPVLNISVKSVSEGPVIEDRYEVNLIARGINGEYARLMSEYMKEGFVASEDGLEMQTSVYVQNPTVFCECIEWKRKEIDKQWESFYDMTPAVDG